MPKGTTNENLRELEKLVKKVIRKSLKDNTLDYTVQYTMSSLDPGQVKYAAQISSPAKGVQPITFVFDTYNDLKNSLIEAEQELDRSKVELIFHQNRINTYKTKIDAHEERIKKIKSGEPDEEDDGIELEEV